MGDHDSVRRTPLFDELVASGGKMVPFAGFILPVQFDGIAKEHHRVRNDVGLFDVSHMGEIVFRGERAAQAVQRLTTNNVAGVTAGRAVYTPVCLRSGGIVDDMIFYKVSDTEFFVCVNASNKDKDFAYFVEQTAGECEVIDRSDEFAQIAVQGPKAPELLGRIFGADVAELKPFRFLNKEFAGAKVLVTTTGYTGERGGEIYVPTAVAVELWRTLMSKGQDLGVGPIGLGARDSLRLEMKYCLYGNDIDETTTPLDASLAWTVKFDKGDFLGRDAMIQQKEAGLTRSLVMFKCIEKGIPRHGYGVYAGGKKVGDVTSGTLSPSLGYPMGMAYVDKPHDAIGSRIEIDLKGLRMVEAEVVEAPLYKGPKD